MKISFRVDPAAVQQAVILHVEKGVLVLAGIVFLFLVYQSIMVKGYEKTPNDLVTTAVEAQKHLDSQPGVSLVKTVPFEEKAGRLTVPVNAKEYGLEMAWNKPLWPERRKRGEPTIHPVKDLQIAEGRGAIPVAQVRGESKWEGIRWVVLTGLIEYAAQVDAYHTTFENCDHPNGPAADQTPRYYVYKIQRAEVQGDAPVKDSDWMPIKRSPYLEQVRVLRMFGTGRPGDVVEPNRLLDSQLALPNTGARNAPATATFAFAFPIPPVKTFDQKNQQPNDYSWGDEAAHPPEIPRVASATIITPVVNRPRVERSRPGSGAAPVEIDPTADPTAPVDPTAATTPPAPATAPPVAGGTVPDMPPQPDPSASKESEYRLFRHFDFLDLEPGKTYRYRVRLVLENPNYLGEKYLRCLERPELAKNDKLESAWTVSDPIYIPHDAQVMVAECKTSAPPSQPLALAIPLAIAVFNPKNGTTRSQEVAAVVRGELLNQKDTYQTDTMVLDAFPARPIKDVLKANLPEPTGVLLMDLSGNLTVRREIDDIAGLPTVVQPRTPPMGPPMGLGPEPPGKEPQVPLDDLSSGAKKRHGGKK